MWLRLTFCSIAYLALLAPVLAQSNELAAAKVAPALKAFLAPQAGNTVCFTRAYDAAHLRAHPRQKVEQMTFAVEVEYLEEDKLFRYLFTMRARIKGVRKLQETSGECGWAYAERPSQETGIRCNVECDGGGVAIEPAAGNASLLVRLKTDNTEGRIRMAACGESEEEKSIELLSGVDDRSFRLTKADAKACAGPKR